MSYIASVLLFVSGLVLIAFGWTLFSKKRKSKRQDAGHNPALAEILIILGVLIFFAGLIFLEMFDFGLWTAEN